MTSEAADWWAKIVAEWVLDDAGLLILQSGLEAFGRMREAAVLVDEHGVVTSDRFGQLKMNPAVTIEKDSRAAMLQAFKQLHLDLEPLKPPGRPAGK